MLRPSNDPDAQSGPDGTRGHAFYPVLLGRARMYAEPCRAAYGALADAVGADPCVEPPVDRRNSGQRNHPGASAEAGRIRHGLRRQVAPGPAEAVSPAAARFRPLLWPALLKRHEPEVKSAGRFPLSAAHSADPRR